MKINVRCVILFKNSIILCYNIKGGFYFLPGGKLEENETIYDCIKRELNEEMGLKKEQIKINSYNHVIEHIYTMGNKQFNEINILKYVYLDSDIIESKENHIGFERIKLQDLNNVDLKPTSVKEYILEQIK